MFKVSLCILIHVPFVALILTGSVPKPNFHGYLSSEASASISHQLYSSTDLRGHSSDYLQKEVKAVVNNDFN